MGIQSNPASRRHCRCWFRCWKWNKTIPSIFQGSAQIKSTFCLSFPTYCCLKWRSWRHLSRGCWKTQAWHCCRRDFKWHFTDPVQGPHSQPVLQLLNIIIDVLWCLQRLPGGLAQGCSFWLWSTNTHSVPWKWERICALGALLKHFSQRKDNCWG